MNPASLNDNTCSQGVPPTKAAMLTGEGDAASGICTAITPDPTRAPTPLQPDAQVTTPVPYLHTDPGPQP